MKSFTVVNQTQFNKIEPRNNKLKDNVLFKKIFDEFVSTVYSNDKINHDWVNYILYYDIDDNIHVYFKKYFITKIKGNITVDIVDIKNIFDEIILNIKKLSIALPICYLYDVPCHQTPSIFFR
jgi:hypothetical protein